MRLHIVQGTHKFDIVTPTNVDVNESTSSGTDWTLKQLKQELQKYTRVPSENMRLLHKGKSLPMSPTEQTKMLPEFNIKDGDKIMVLGKPCEPELDETAKKLMHFEQQNMKCLDEHTTQLRDDVDALAKAVVPHGFLSRDQQSEALRKAHKRRLQVNEECMRALEFLDAFSVPHNENLEKNRAKRKSYVQQIQSILDQLDSLHEELQRLDESNAAVSPKKKKK